MVTKTMASPLLSGRKFRLLKDAPKGPLGTEDDPLGGYASLGHLQMAEAGVTRIDLDDSDDLTPGDPELTVYEGNNDAHEAVGYDELKLAVQGAGGEKEPVAGDSVMDQLYYNATLERPVCTSVLDHEIEPHKLVESAYSMDANGQLFVEFHPPQD